MKDFLTRQTVDHRIVGCDQHRRMQEEPTAAAVACRAETGHFAMDAKFDFGRVAE